MMETGPYPTGTTHPEETSSVESAREALTQALAARDIPFTYDPEWGTVAVGACTIVIWATCCPYAVYGKGDWLPRRQFERLPALLQFLRDGLCRAA